MNSKLIALASAAIALTAVAIPNQVEARWRGGGGWWIPGAIVGGLALGAAALPGTKSDNAESRTRERREWDG